MSQGLGEARVGQDWVLHAQVHSLARRPENSQASWGDLGQHRQPWTSAEDFLWEGTQAESGVDVGRQQGPEGAHRGKRVKGAKG